MTNDISLPDPVAYGLKTFADVLPDRDPIVGEDPGSFDGFRAGLIKALTPLTPYELVIAENLVAIEWELVQQRRMRDAGLREAMRKKIQKAVASKLYTDHEVAMEDAWERHFEAGGTEDDWEEPDKFDRDAAKEAGDDLAARAISRDLSVQQDACVEISELGLLPVELMSEAYSASRLSNVTRHDEKVQELERRRREIKRDFDALQKMRPVEATVEVVDA